MVTTRANAAAARAAKAQTVAQQEPVAKPSLAAQSIHNNRIVDYQGRYVKILQTAALTGGCLAVTVGFGMATKWQLDDLAQSIYSLDEVLTLGILNNPLALLIVLPLRYGPQLAFGGATAIAGIATAAFATQTVVEASDLISTL